jgi:hypothetical protein
LFDEKSRTCVGSFAWAIIQHPQAKEAEKQRERRRTAAHTKRGNWDNIFFGEWATALIYISAFEAIVPVDASERKRGNQRAWRQTTKGTVPIAARHVTPKWTLSYSNGVRA